MPPWAKFAMRCAKSGEATSRKESPSDIYVDVGGCIGEAAAVDGEVGNVDAFPSHRSATELAGKG